MLAARALIAAFITLAILAMRPTAADVATPGRQRPLVTTDDALDCVFSGGSDSDRLPSLDVLWFVRGRVIPSDQPEWQYTVKQLVGGRVEVEFVNVEGNRLIGRPETVKAKTCADLLSWAKVARRVLTTEQCAPLRLEVSRFKQLKLPNVPDGSVRLHSSRYGIRAGTPEGDEYRWRLAGRSEQPGATHPLADWSEDLRRAFDQCPPQR